MVITPTEAPIAQIMSPTQNSNHYSDQLIQVSGIVSDNEDNPEDLIVTWSSSLDGDLILDTTPDSDGNISDNSSNNGSSAGNLSDTSQSNVDNRNRVIRGLRRRSRPKSRTSTVRHQPSEASIDEIEEESDVSIDDSDNDFEISPAER